MNDKPILLGPNGQPLKAKATGPDAYWVIEKIDGGYRQRSRGQCFPLTEQRLFAKQLVFALDQNIAHGGNWLVIWNETTMEVRHNGRIAYNVPSIVRAWWRDPDRDVRAVVYIDESMDTLFGNGTAHWVQQAERGWQAVAGFWKDMELAPWQTRKAALGDPGETRPGSIGHGKPPLPN